MPGDNGMQSEKAPSGKPSPERELSSKGLKEVREWIMWVSGGRTFQGEFQQVKNP